MAQLVKNPAAVKETWVQSLGWEDSLEKEMAYRIQYSGLENSMNCIVHGVAKSWTQLSDFLLNLYCCMGFSVTAMSGGLFSSCGAQTSHCSGFSCC